MYMYIPVDVEVVGLLRGGEGWGGERIREEGREEEEGGREREREREREDIMNVLVPH